MQHVWGRGKVHRVFWWVNLKERDNFQDLSMDWIGGHGLN